MHKVTRMLLMLHISLAAAPYTVHLYRLYGAIFSLMEYTDVQKYILHKNTSCHILDRLVKCIGAA